MGIAAWFCHFGYFAEVADVTVEKDNKVTVDRHLGSRRYGQPGINPGAAENLNAGRHHRKGLAMWRGSAHALQRHDPAVKLHNYPLMRIKQVPKIEVFCARPITRRRDSASQCSAGFAGSLQCHLCGNRQADQDAAAEGERIRLGIREWDLAGLAESAQALLVPLPA